GAAARQAVQPGSVSGVPHRRLRQARLRAHVRSCAYAPSDSARAMKIGVGLHPDRGHQIVLEEARQADLQGFDSVWLNDHMMGLRTAHSPAEPLDSLTLMTTIGAMTTRVRLAWGMLNPSFRPAAVLAKMLATLDVLTGGRVICSIGAGWLKEEYLAYGVPFFADHAERNAPPHQGIHPPQPALVGGLLPVVVV